jgi:nitrous oxide reductase accessory protein NosL
MEPAKLSLVARVLLFFTIALLAGCSNERRTAAAAPETLTNIPVITVQKVTVPDWL